MTPSKLRAQTYKDLAQMAKLQGIAGWHAMRKEDLVRALVNEARRKGRRKAARNGHAAGSQATRSNENSVKRREKTISRRPNNSAAVKKLRQLQEKLEALKHLGTQSPDGPSRGDRLVVLVRDPYWLHACWELTDRSVQRARSAMGQHWHHAEPVLRLFRQTEERGAVLARQIPIHGGVSNWYVDVQDPPCEFRMEIGYAAKGAPFYCLARSNEVRTPAAGTSDQLDDNWSDVADNADRIFAMSGGYSPQGTSLELQELLEDRLHRPMGSPMKTRYGEGAARSLAVAEDLQFAIDAELVVYGASHRLAHVTVEGEPVHLRPDGTFAVRLPLPERRQVIPVVASSPDGSEQRTIILAVERNTKSLDPVVRDPARPGG